MKPHDPLQKVAPAVRACATPLIPIEDPGIDPNPMIHLFSRLEEAAAEREICAILDAINCEVTQIRMAPDLAALRKLEPSIDRLCRKSSRLGLYGMARVTADVARCVQSGDTTALAATIARLIRVADRSMTQIWHGSTRG